VKRPIGKLYSAKRAVAHGVSGNVLKATINGSTITAYLNGVEVVQATDSTYTNGSPGIGFYLRGATGLNANYGFSYFTATDGTLSNPTPGQVSLAWDLDNDSTVVGYNLYYTTNPTALTQAMHPPIPGTADKISGMSTTTTTLTGLTSGAVFYFGLTAYNANGIESALSNVVSTPVP